MGRKRKPRKQPDTSADHFHGKTRDEKVEKRSTWCPVAREFYDSVKKDWEIADDDLPGLTMLRNATEILHRAEACRADYVQNGIWISVATGNGISEKVNPALNLERQLRSTFGGLCKQMGIEF